MPKPKYASAPQPRGRPRDVAVDRAVLSATLALLAEQGFARMTMDDLAARAGVGKASLYLRWPNKVAVVAEALRQRAAVVPASPLDTGALRTDMLAFLRALLRRRSASAAAVAALAGEIQAYPELRDAWRDSVRATVVGSVKIIVERAVARGELPERTDVELLSALPLVLLQNWRLANGEPPDERAIERIVAQFFTSSLARTPARNRSARR